MTKHQITIHPNRVGPGAHGVTIDGQDISGAVRSATLLLEGGSVPELELNLRLEETPAIDTGPAVITVPWATKQALEVLGWTAPPDLDNPPDGDVAHVDWALGLALNLLQGHHMVECDCVDDHRCEGWKCGKCGYRWPCPDDHAQSTLLEARKRLSYRAPATTPEEI